MTGAYAATKYALQGLSDALRVELRGTGVEVSVVCPGYTTSEFSDKVIDYGAARARGRRGAMTSEEVAEAIFRCARSPRRQVVLTGQGRLLVWLERRLVQRYLERRVRRGMPNSGPPFQDALFARELLPRGVLGVLLRPLPYLTWLLASAAFALLSTGYSLFGPDLDVLGRSHLDTLWVLVDVDERDNHVLPCVVVQIERF